MNLQGYERLMRDHAYWAGRVRDLKRQSSDALWETSGCGHDGRTCIDVAFQECGEMNEDDAPGEGCTFEEVWESMLAEAKVCWHCQQMRRLKAERIQASRRLGAVRAAITRVGRRLSLKEAP